MSEEVSRLKSGAFPRLRVHKSSHSKLGAGTEEVGYGDDYYGTECGGGEAVEEAIGAAYDAEPGEDPAADYAADQAQDNICNAAEAAAAGEFSGEPTCD